MADDVYTSRVDKAIQEDGSFLWPWQLDKDGNKIKRKFDKEELERRKKKHGPRSFAQEYMNEVAPAEGMVLKRDWIQTYDELPPQQFLDVYMGIDPAMEGDTKKGSALAIAAIAFDRRRDHPHIYVLELYKSTSNPPLSEQFKSIDKMVQRWKPLSCNMESALVNRHFAKHVIDRFPNFYPIDYMHTRLKGTTEVNKDLRIKNIIGLYFEEGFVSLRDPTYDQGMRDFIETEYIEFPFGDKDLLDALNLAVDLVDLSADSADLPLYSF
jgi:hypothetical protein